MAKFDICYFVLDWLRGIVDAYIPPSFSPEARNVLTEPYFCTLYLDM
jgi:hypothetical protein